MGSTFPHFFRCLNTATRAVLGQQDGQAPYAIYYISKNLAPTELNYTVIEKEFLAIIYSINKFQNYITGYPTFVHIDHSSIKYLMKKLVTNARITRWMLQLQEFDITIIDRPGKENVVADFLSHFTNSDDNLLVEDYFPEEHFFAFSSHSPWYADVANYLVQTSFRHICQRERKGKLFSKVPGIAG